MCKAFLEPTFRGSVLTKPTPCHIPENNILQINTCIMHRHFSFGFIIQILTTVLPEGIANLIFRYPLQYTCYAIINILRQFKTKLLQIEFCSLEIEMLQRAYQVSMVDVLTHSCFLTNAGLMGSQYPNV
jgi:hypothetical protein